MGLVAGQLSPKNYEFITASMVSEGRDRGLPNACVLLGNATNIVRDPDFPDGYDTTFTSQMHTMVSGKVEADNRVLPPPAAYLVTAKSAIPVADSLRGFLQAAGCEIPALGYVEANRSVSGYEAWYHEQPSLFYSEAERLRSVVADAEHVCIIDQFVDSGGTLTFASQVLQHVGVPIVSGMRGRWYANTLEGEVDQLNLTSVHQQVMHDIGVAASRLAFGS